jgi:hypothetical protein
MYRSDIFSWSDGRYKFWCTDDSGTNSLSIVVERAEVPKSWNRIIELTQWLMLADS